MAELRGALVPSAGLRTILHKPSSTGCMEETELEHGVGVLFVGLCLQRLHFLLVFELRFPCHRLVAIDHAALHEVLERVAHLRRRDELCPHSRARAWAALVLSKPLRDVCALVTPGTPA
eukprot:scaffold30408_cov69-Phaeocystis_antarctica.AAC.5